MEPGDHTTVTAYYLGWYKHETFQILDGPYFDFELADSVAETYREKGETRYIAEVEIPAKLTCIRE